MFIYNKNSKNTALKKTKKDNILFYSVRSPYIMNDPYNIKNEVVVKSYFDKTETVSDSSDSDDSEGVFIVPLKKKILKKTTEQIDCYSSISYDS